MISVPRRMVVRCCVLGAILWAGLALAAAESFQVALSGSQTVPPVESSGKGVATITYDPATHLVGWTITYSGLSGPVTMAHFHGPAGKGENAGVQLWLTRQGSPAENPIKGQATLTPEQAKDFIAGKWYVNLHTKDHPAGEIRGQVVPPKR
jgi:CHRD domain